MPAIVQNNESMRVIIVAGSVKGTAGKVMYNYSLWAKCTKNNCTALNTMWA